MHSLGVLRYQINVELPRLLRLVCFICENAVYIRLPFSLYQIPVKIGSITGETDVAAVATVSKVPQVISQV